MNGCEGTYLAVYVVSSSGVVITCRMLLPSDQPANWSGVPSWATALLGALTSRWKPSTPVTVRGVLTGTPSTTTPSPGGDVARLISDFLGRMVTILLVDRPLASVAVTLTSYDVSAEASPVLGIVNEPARPVSGPTNGWKCVPWCSLTSVLMLASLRSNPAPSVANAL